MNQSEKKFHEQQNEDSFTMRMEKKYLYMQIFIAAAISCFVIAVSIIALMDHPTQNDKIAIGISAILLVSILIIPLIIVKYVYTGFILKIDNRGIVFGNGRCTKLIGLKKDYVFLPWKNVYAIINSEWNYLTIPDYSFLYIVTCKDCSGSFKKTYSFPIGYFSHEDRNILPDKVNQYKPDFIKDKSEKYSWIYKFVNENQDKKSEEILKKFEKEK